MQTTISKRGQTVVPALWQMEEPDVLISARLKAHFRISFADSIIAATAVRHDAFLVHKDPAYKCLSGVIKQRSLL